MIFLGFGDSPPVPEEPSSPILKSHFGIELRRLWAKPSPPKMRAPFSLSLSVTSSSSSHFLPRPFLALHDLLPYPKLSYARHSTLMT